MPDCDLTSRVLNGECGAMDNRNFGTPVITTRFDPAVTEGWGVRPYNWQTSLAVQHELRPGFAVAVSYFRTSWTNGGPGSGDFQLTDNLLVTPADYDTYCVTAPTDPRLPGGGGYPVCGLYDVKPAKFGQVDNLITNVSNFGTRTNVYNGLEFSVNARFGRGGVLSGGVGMGRTIVDYCAAADFPAQFCRNVAPFKGDTQVKFSGAYPLPWGFQASGAIQNLSGRPIAATMSIPNCPDRSLARTQPGVVRRGGGVHGVRDGDDSRTEHDVRRPLHAARYADQPDVPVRPDEGAAEARRLQSVQLGRGQHVTDDLRGDEQYVAPAAGGVWRTDGESRRAD